MASPILVLAESSGEKVLSLSLEALAMGQKAARECGASLSVLVCGKAVSTAANELLGYGADRVLVVDHDLLGDLHPDLLCAAVSQACDIIKPGALFMAETLAALDLAPRLAARLKTGCASDCVDVSFSRETGGFIFTKPVYSGNVMARFALSGEPVVATFRARAAEAPEFGAASGQVENLDVHLESSLARYEVVEKVFDDDTGGPKLKNADRIVSGGRGMGGPEGFAVLAELAKALGGAVGASRPPCDLGWISPVHQVGITGAIVAPSLYIATGISGSTQHVAGMAEAKVIVAINNKADANIFKIADFGIVGDWEKIIPALIRAFSESKG
ncbi:MAG: electron transfer flavoprotein subunit alpha/FixB family protein [Thermodesulfobacteriota bacterium]